jgi:hypothetical protein
MQANYAGKLCRHCMNTCAMGGLPPLAPANTVNGGSSFNALFTVDPSFVCGLSSCGAYALKQTGRA